MAARPQVPLPETPQALTYFVAGLDCANCVAKVERMVGTLPGTEGVRTSFTRQTLTLELDEHQTSRATLEKNLKALGYTPSLLRPVRVATAPAHPAPDPAGQDHARPDPVDHEHAGHTHEVAPAGTPWYHTGQGRLVLSSGVLLLAAWLFGFTEPRFAAAGYVAATLLGVWPLQQVHVLVVETHQQEGDVGSPRGIFRKIDFFKIRK